MYVPSDLDPCNKDVYKEERVKLHKNYSCGKLFSPEAKVM
jgi:hypothetical protein